MSTNETNERSDEMRDPTEDKYLELEKRLGAAEYALAAVTAWSRQLLLRPAPSVGTASSLVSRDLGGAPGAAASGALVGPRHGVAGDRA